MDLKQLEKLLSNPAHINILSTADTKGNPNSAIFGSGQLIENQIIIGCGDNRTLKNLRQNPKAALLITVPGKSILAYQGIRLDLNCCVIDEDDPLLVKIQDEVRITAGRTAARMIQYLLRFNIIETRDLVNLSSIFTTK
jgi:Pyridoxamine 5'-phosphate oxidase